MVTRRRQQLGALAAIALAIAGLATAVWISRHHGGAKVATGPVGTFTQPGVTTIPSTQITHTGSSYETTDFTVELPAGVSGVKEQTGPITQLTFALKGMSARVRSQQLQAGQTLEDVASVYGLPHTAKRLTVGGHKGYLYSFRSGSSLSQIVVSASGTKLYFIQIVSPVGQQARATKLIKQLGKSTKLK